MEINTSHEIKTGVETNHILDVSDRLYKIIMSTLGGVAVLGLGWMYFQFGMLPSQMPQQVSFTGEGKAAIKPDIASVTFGVTSEGQKSQDVVNANNTKMNAVIKAIKEAGVDEKDIRTTMYQLTPKYGYTQAPVASATKAGMASAPVYGRQVFDGYTLEQQIEVKIRKFENINTVMDKATTSGANTVGSLQFTVDDMETVRAQAREEAIKQAKEKANTLARQSGLKLGKIVNVYDNSGYPMPYYGGVGMGGAEMAKDASVAPSLQPGQQEVVVSVTLSYWVK